MDYTEMITTHDLQYCRPTGIEEVNMIRVYCMQVYRNITARCPPLFNLYLLRKWEK
jgi:hypothetical protein